GIESGRQAPKIGANRPHSTTLRDVMPRTRIRVFRAKPRESLSSVHPPVVPRSVERHRRHLDWLTGLLGLDDPATTDVERHVTMALVVEDQVAWAQLALGDGVGLVPLTAGVVRQRLPAAAHAVMVRPEQSNLFGPASPQ